MRHPDRLIVEDQSVSILQGTEALSHHIGRGGQSRGQVVDGRRRAAFDEPSVDGGSQSLLLIRQPGRHRQPFSETVRECIPGQE